MTSRLPVLRREKKPAGVRPAHGSARSSPPPSDCGHAVPKRQQQHKPPPATPVSANNSKSVTQSHPSTRLESTQHRSNTSARPTSADAELVDSAAPKGTHASTTLRDLDQKVHKNHTATSQVELQSYDLHDFGSEKIPTLSDPNFPKPESTPRSLGIHHHHPDQSNIALDSRRTMGRDVESCPKQTAQETHAVASVVPATENGERRTTVYAGPMRVLRQPPPTSTSALTPVRRVALDRPVPQRQLVATPGHQKSQVSRLVTAAASTTKTIPAESSAGPSNSLSDASGKTTPRTIRSHQHVFSCGKEIQPHLSTTATPIPLRPTGPMVHPHLHLPSRTPVASVAGRSDVLSIQPPMTPRAMAARNLARELGMFLVEADSLNAHSAAKTPHGRSHLAKLSISTDKDENRDDEGGQTVCPVVHTTSSSLAREPRRTNDAFQQQESHTPSLLQHQKTEYSLESGCSFTDANARSTSARSIYTPVHVSDAFKDTHTLSSFDVRLVSSKAPATPQSHVNVARTPQTKPRVPLPNPFDVLGIVPLSESKGRNHAKSVHFADEICMELIKPKITAGLDTSTAPHNATTPVVNTTTSSHVEGSDAAEMPGLARSPTKMEMNPMQNQGLATSAVSANTSMRDTCVASTDVQTPSKSNPDARQHDSLGGLCHEMSALVSMDEQLMHQLDVEFRRTVL